LPAATLAPDPLEKALSPAAGGRANLEALDKLRCLIPPYINDFI